MPHDICMSEHAETRRPHVLPVALWIVIILMISVWVFGDQHKTMTVPNNIDQSAIQEWHGNVMRSNWTK